MPHPSLTLSSSSFWGCPVAPGGGSRYAWEFHLTLECPGWSADRERLATADIFTGNLGQAVDHYLTLVAERGGLRVHVAVCRCLIAPVPAGITPELHGTITIQLNP